MCAEYFRLFIIESDSLLLCQILIYFFYSFIHLFKQLMIVSKIVDDSKLLLKCTGV